MRDIPLGLRIGAITLFVIILVIMGYPILFMVFAGMKDNVMLATNPLGPPIPPNFDNIRTVWIEEDFLIYFKNALIVSLISVFGTVVMCASAAYVFARGKLGASNWLFGVILLGMMVPGQVALIPVFWLMGRIGLLNTLWSVIFVHLSWTPFGIFVLRTYFFTIPAELADAGRIDGCNEFGLFWRVYLPLAGPALVTVAIFAFIWSFNSMTRDVVCRFLVWSHLPEVSRITGNRFSISGTLTTFVGFVAYQ